MTDKDWTYILGQLDGKMDLMLENQRSTNEEMHSRLDGHGHRITKLEHNHSKILGACAVISAAFAAAFQWFLGNK